MLKNATFLAIFKQCEILLVGLVEMTLKSFTVTYAAALSDHTLDMYKSAFWYTFGLVLVSVVLSLVPILVTKLPLSVLELKLNSMDTVVWVFTVKVSSCVISPTPSTSEIIFNLFVLVKNTAGIL